MFVPIDGLLSDLPFADARTPRLIRLQLSLARAWPWLAVLPEDIAQHVFTMHEVVAWRNMTLTKGVTESLVCSGSTLISDFCDQRMLDYTMRPAIIQSRLGRQVFQWLQSPRVTNRILGLHLRRASVSLADVTRVQREACRACHTELWAAAALALFPCRETLELTRQRSAVCRTTSALAWSAAQIVSSMATTTPPEPLTEMRRHLQISFDVPGIKRAIVRLRQALG